jgi:hypothetical protein
MLKLIAAATIAASLSGIALSGTAMAQTPPATANIPKEADTLGWMQGARLHTNAEGKGLVYEAFVGPLNGVVTGTALAISGSFVEYHKIGPNAEGVYGLDVANTRTQLKWNFTPLKSIEPGRITFQSADGKLTIAYYKEGKDGVGSRVDRIGADGKTITSEYHFKAQPFAK